MIEIIERRKGDTLKMVKRMRKRMKNEAPKCEDVLVSYLELDYMLHVISGALAAGIIKTD